jgi:transcriptional regulator with XRE-family HTH domain
MRLWREYREMSQEEAGEAVGLSHAQIGRIENGLQQYKQSLVLKLAKLYDTDPVSLLELDPPNDFRPLLSYIGKASSEQLKDLEKYADFLIHKDEQP